MTKSLTCILVRITTNGETTQTVVSEGQFYVGRASECAISIKMPGISRQHLLVKNKRGKVWVEDQGSSNGTRMNETTLKGHRLTPIEPDDRIFLGASTEVTLEAVNRTWSGDAVEESSLNEEDRESVKNLIQGAHAEAARLVMIGKETHDDYIKTAEQNAAAIEKKMSANFEQVMNEAGAKAQVVIDKAKAHHDDLIARAEADAKVASENETKRIMAETRVVATKFLEEAKAKSGEVFAQALEKSEAQVQEQRAQREAEIEQELKVKREKLEQEFDRLRVAQLQALKVDRASAFAELDRERERIGENILRLVEAEVIKAVSPQDWNSMAKSVGTAIQNGIEYAPPNEAADDTVSHLIVQLNRKRWRPRIFWTVQGLLIGALMLAGSQQALEALHSYQSPMQTAVDAEAQRVKDDLANRRFNPEQDETWRDSYADSVIYTRDFVQKYLAEDFQKVWLKTAQVYFLKNWRVEEETVVEVVAKLNVLVNSLNERKAAIHPDFVKSGVQKMNELESQTLDEVRLLLGSRVRVEALKKIEKQAYSEFYLERRPAQVDQNVEEKVDESKESTEE